jgi:hypothetical protein
MPKVVMTEKRRLLINGYHEQLSQLTTELQVVEDDLGKNEKRRGWMTNPKFIPGLVDDHAYLLTQKTELIHEICDVRDRLEKACPMSCVLD